MQKGQKAYFQSPCFKVSDISSPSRYGQILQETLKSLAPDCTVTFATSEHGCVFGAARVAAATLRLKHQQEGVAQVLAPFRLSMSDMDTLRTMMRQEMEKGLSKETHSTATVRMLPTYVRHLPDGSGESQRTTSWEWPLSWEGRALKSSRGLLKKVSGKLCLVQRKPSEFWGAPNLLIDMGLLLLLLTFISL